MLSLTRKADYAIVIMADLASRGASRSSARELAASTRVPLPVLTNLMHQLLHHGLVSSTMGSKGGYRLAKDPTDISLAEMIDAIEGRFKLTVCCNAEDDCEDDRCDLQDNCQIREPVRRVHESLQHLLNSVTLSQLAAETRPVAMTMGGAEVSRREFGREA